MDKSSSYVELNTPDFTIEEMVDAGQPTARKTNDIPPETLAALVRGDYEAFDTVFLKFYNPVKRFLAALTKSGDDAEELCQEIFAKLWVNRAQINPNKNFKSYLYTVARNAAMNHFRDRQVREAYAKHTGWFPEGASYTEEEIIARETQLLIDLVVSKMPKQRKKIFMLSRTEGLSNEEIARQLNITKNAVERHLTFALKDIRKVLQAFALFFMA